MPRKVSIPVGSTHPSFVECRAHHDWLSSVSSALELLSGSHGNSDHLTNIFTSVLRRTALVNLLSTTTKTTAASSIGESLSLRRMALTMLQSSGLNTSLM